MTNRTADRSNLRRRTIPRRKAASLGLTSVLGVCSVGGAMGGCAGTGPDSAMASEEAFSSASRPVPVGASAVTLQAEDFDRGGEGTGYHDSDPQNRGGKYRSTGVDIKVTSDTSGAYAVGWTIAGEWLDYTLGVTTAATYSFEARVASAVDGAGFHVEIDGVNVTGTLSVPNTGPWDSEWATISHAGLALPAGTHVMRVVAETDDYDLNYFVLRPTGGGSGAPPSSDAGPPAPGTPPDAGTPPASTPDASAPPPTTGTDAGANETPGPSEPVGPQASITCTGVAVSPGDDVQSEVDANPAGTTFCFAAGTFAKATVTAKDNDQFIGKVGTIFDGQKSAYQAFDGQGANVLVENLVVTNYTAPPQQGGIQEGTGWTVRNNEVSYNAGCGIDLGNSSKTIANYSHHNEQEGYCGGGLTNVLVDSNEFAFNNVNDLVDPGWEAGGGKMAVCSEVVIQHNYAHDNHGPGLWSDINDYDFQYLYNRVENNAGGIFYEISYNALIKGNLTKNNSIATYCPGWLWCGDIQIAASGGVNGGQVEITGNTVITDSTTYAGNAISLIQQDRGTGDKGPYYVQDVYVHDNTIDLSLGGNTGGVEDLGDDSIFTSRNNRFVSNTYTLGTNTEPFMWADDSGGQSFWQKAGQDLQGTFE